MKEENNDPIQDYNMSKKKQVIQDEILSGYTEKSARRRMRRHNMMVIAYCIVTVMLLPSAITMLYIKLDERKQVNETTTITNTTIKNEEKTSSNMIIETQQNDLAIEKKEDFYYDNLKLQVGDLYNVHGENEKIVVFCSVISGTEPKVGELFHIESKASSDLVYEATVYDVEHYIDYSGKDGLRVYFDGVTTEILAFTPEIRRVK